MKHIKTFALIAFVFSASGVFADAANLLLSFSTEGPDRYADGGTVATGEWYALCWTPNETFGGITTEFLPAVTGDRVMMAAPLAVDGHCPYVIFQIDSKAIPTGGRYFVYLLDTRDANGKPAAQTVKDGKLAPVLLNGAVASTRFTTSGGVTSRTVETAKVEDGAWGESAVDTSAAGFTQAKISAIEVAGTQVKITVEGMMPGIRYNIKAGETVGHLDTYALETPAMKQGESANFFIDKDDAKFFQVVREPLKK